MRTYDGDPYWITLRYPGMCAGCGCKISKGTDAFRYKDGSLYGEACGCGETAENDFQALAHDECMYHHGFEPEPERF